MTEQFNNLPWHDAVLLDLQIDRSDPGNRDLVELAISWPDGKSQRLVFEDCYRLRVDMNFGVVAPDSIDTANASVRATDLTELIDKWRTIGVELEGLARYEIATSSTGGSICVFAKSWRLEDAT